ncbi:MAG: small subunit ribosomal protein [Candidatus Atribacteria bacterium]|uniref:Small ribosomal subunit protein uS17 n=1 Tax=Thermatribacter velox TaxID=3039681 RepID=A0ABZ2YEJ6_9BACT|nr:small subunit ribosomal protein [Candidatus Atribacteria bacterium]MDI3530755.1 small subunit ribosomal protein [Candidatus Atribacteria bacterium]
MPGPKRLVGTVISDAMDKTVVVEVIRLSEHPLYGKKVKRKRKFKAHDEANTCKLGDKVLIEETRPLSKTKRWRVVTVLERSVEEGGEEIDSTNYNA